MTGGVRRGRLCPLARQRHEALLQAALADAQFGRRKRLIVEMNSVLAEQIHIQPIGALEQRKLREDRAQFATSASVARERQSVASGKLHFHDRQIERLTRDHSLVQDLVNAGMMNPQEAETHPNSNVITRAVGVVEDLRVEVVSGEVMPGDQYLLASDGLTRLVGDEELVTELLTQRAAEAADRLIEIVLSRGAPDNISIIIVDVT